MHEIRGDRYRLSPLILFATTLLLPGEITVHLNNLVIDLVTLESVVQRNGIWGRYVVYVDADFVSAFRYAIFYGNFDSSTHDFVARIHLMVNSLVKSVEGSCGLLHYRWQTAAVPGHGFYDVCCIVDDSQFMAEMLIRDTPTAQGLDMAQRSDPSQPVYTLVGVVSGQFPVWDNATYPAWYYGADSPHGQSYSSGYCYRRLYYKSVTQDYGKWLKVRVLRTLPCNPFMRCVPVASGKWHVPSPRSAWVPNARCLKDLPSTVRVGGDDVIISVPTSLSPLPSVAEICTMSIAIAKFYEFTPGGISFGHISRNIAASQAPYSTYLLGFPIRRRGYVIYPVAVLPVEDRLSVHLVFCSKPVAGYLLSGDKRYALDVSDSSVSFSIRAKDVAFVMVLFPDNYDYADVSDMLAADVQSNILSKL